MIKEFNDVEVRASGVINRGMFEQVKMLYLQNPEMGGELAVSLMEQVLTGQHSSDNFMVNFAIANHKEVIAQNQQRYDSSKEAKQEAIEAGLRDIADLVNAGFKQVEIAAKLGLSQSVVSKKVSKIRKDFPHLLKIGKSESSVNLESIPNIPNVGKSESLENIPNLPICGKSGKLESFSESRQDLSNIPTFQVDGKLESLERNPENLESLEIIPKLPTFQNFQDVNVNVNVNENVNVGEKNSPKSGVKFEF